VRSYDFRTKDAKMHVTAIVDEYEIIVPWDFYEPFLDEIFEEAEQLVDGWMAESEPETDHKANLPIIPGIPRSVRLDADVPVTPGTVGYSYI